MSISNEVIEDDCSVNCSNEKYLRTRILYTDYDCFIHVFNQIKAVKNFKDSRKEIEKLVEARRQSFLKWDLKCNWQRFAPWNLPAIERKEFFL